ncbi:phosphatidylinositol glycan, class A [Apostasia shenzhenica]|uniref:Phosphatidylinositol glycan, class A n=1 Tax=Apostasia shenzhenica TaxID=1088818 RepID=A0A2I0ATS5_9ASPA|nr:phosphatidylinositol glycan, class A [Apostasia shenzhenica]
MAIAGINGRPKRAAAMSYPAFSLVLLLFLGAILILLLRSPTISSPLPCIPRASDGSKLFTGDLRHAEFSWNSLRLPSDRPAPTSLKIAVFSRKWPSSSVPGGMERHALTLHSALAHRGHRVHVFTSATDHPISGDFHSHSPRLHLLDGPPGRWRSDEAFALFEEENSREPFDVVHSESVALFHRYARQVPNLAVSWHGISLEALHSGIYQDLIRGSDEPLSQAFNRSLAAAIYKVLDEIRFFQSYAHHVAISDSTGEMLRDVYQIPSGRVHIILNGVDEEDFRPDPDLGSAYRLEIGVPADAELVLGVAGRLVKDKGHPLLFEAFAGLVSRYSKVYLVVAGSGPWEQRYREMGENVMVAGALPPAKLRAFYNSIDVFVNPS